MLFALSGDFYHLAAVFARRSGALAVMACTRATLLDGAKRRSLMIGVRGVPS